MGQGYINSGKTGDLTDNKFSDESSHENTVQIPLYDEIHRRHHDKPSEVELKDSTREGREVTRVEVVVASNYLDPTTYQAVTLVTAPEILHLFGEADVVELRVDETFPYWVYSPVYQVKSTY
nr:hypothetical protein HmN_000963000 [Hymenolepis microstoma]